MLSLPYCIGHTDQSWYSVEEAYTRSVYQEREILGKHLRCLSWTQWRKAFSFPHWFDMKYHWATLGLIHSGEKPYECNLCGKLSVQTHLNVLSTHDKSVQRNTHIRNVKTPQHIHITEQTMVRYSECNRKALMFSQFLREVRIYSGEKVLLNVISTGKSSIFPILRKLKTHCTEYKDWGNAFNDTLYIRKNIKYSLDAKPVSVLILEDLSMIPVFVDLWGFTVEGDPRNVIGTRMAQPLHGVATK